MAELPELQSNDNWVFLLGAGFSRGFNCPVMNEFMERARHRYFILKAADGDPDLIKAHRVLLDFHAQCSSTTWIFTRHWDNIEELYTQADLLRLARQKGAQALCDNIALAIWDIYRSPRVDTQALLHICTRLRNNFHLNPFIITTNYDTSIEHQLITAQDFHYPGFAYDDHTKIFTPIEGEEPKRGRSIPVIKLHGSANWFRFKDETWIGLAHDHDVAFASDRTHLSAVRDYLNSLPMIAETSHRKRGIAQPAIIPPMLGKATLSKVLEKQWDAAIQALAGARQVWVVGYSFPPTDLFMARLLTAGLGKNHVLQKFVICDYQPLPDWMPRLEKLFSRMMHAYKFQFCSVDAKIMFNELAKDERSGLHPSEWTKLITESLSINHVRTLLHIREASMG